MQSLLFVFPPSPYCKRLLFPAPPAADPRLFFMNTSSRILILLTNLTDQIIVMKKMFCSCVFWIQTKSPFYYLGRTNILSGLAIFNIWAEQEGACNNFRVPTVSGNINHFHFQTWVFLLNRFRSVNNISYLHVFQRAPWNPIPWSYSIPIFFSPFQLYFLYHLLYCTSWICYSQCFINGVDFFF